MTDSNNNNELTQCEPIVDWLKIWYWTDKKKHIQPISWWLCIENYNFQKRFTIKAEEVSLITQMNIIDKWEIL